MCPRPVMPDDEIIYVNDAGIKKKIGKSGNSQKRSDYFMQQRFPFLEPIAVEDREDPEVAKKRKPTPEEQQQKAAPLAKARMDMMQEYQKRLLVQQNQEQEKSSGIQKDNSQEKSEQES